MATVECRDKTPNISCYKHKLKSKLSHTIFKTKNHLAEKRETSKSKFVKQQHNQLEDGGANTRRPYIFEMEYHVPTSRSYLGRKIYPCRHVVRNCIPVRDIQPDESPSGEWPYTGITKRPPTSAIQTLSHSCTKHRWTKRLSCLESATDILIYYWTERLNR